MASSRNWVIAPCETLLSLRLSLSLSLSLSPFFKDLLSQICAMNLMENRQESLDYFGKRVENRKCSPLLEKFCPRYSLDEISPAAGDVTRRTETFKLWHFIIRGPPGWGRERGHISTLPNLVFRSTTSLSLSPHRVVYYSTHTRNSISGPVNCSSFCTRKREIAAAAFGGGGGSDTMGLETIAKTSDQEGGI